MLPFEYRLKKIRDFTLVTKHGRWINGAFLDVKVLVLAKNQEYFPAKENPDTFKKQLKLAFAVGLKISKKAVVRNRLRRQLSEAARLLFKKGEPQAGYFVLVVPKKEALTKEYEALAGELEVLFRRAGICKIIS
jgi:ribonuclease P protein component